MTRQERFCRVFLLEPIETDVFKRVLYKSAEYEGG